jgi:hypothetical protein
MRTTLDIDDDVLMAGKALTKAANKTACKIISDLVRKAMTATPTYVVEAPKAFYGIRPLPHRGGIVTSAMVRRLMDEEGI